MSSNTGSTTEGGNSGSNRRSLSLLSSILENVSALSEALNSENYLSGSQQRQSEPLSDRDNSNSSSMPLQSSSTVPSVSKGEDVIKTEVAQIFRSTTSQATNTRPCPRYTGQSTGHLGQARLIGRGQYGLYSHYRPLSTNLRGSGFTPRPGQTNPIRNFHQFPGRLQLTNPQDQEGERNSNHQQIWWALSLRRGFTQKSRWKYSSQTTTQSGLDGKRPHVSWGHIL